MCVHIYNQLKLLFIIVEITIYSLMSKLSKKKIQNKQITKKEIKNHEFFF
jgi:hypothetical protein